AAARLGQRLYSGRCATGSAPVLRALRDRDCACTRMELTDVSTMLVRSQVRVISLVCPLPELLRVPSRRMAYLLPRVRMGNSRSPLFL
ncbi:hypothetical protein chiPu_0029901, partial [Chiloscyllium punctatum]|nr:hypothetical protein [Chiloscyllium punctatum]